MNIMNFFSKKRKYYFIASVRDAKQEVDDIIKKLEIFQMIINMRIMTAVVGASSDQRKRLFRQLPKTGLI